MPPIEPVAAAGCLMEGPALTCGWILQSSIRRSVVQLRGHSEVPFQGKNLPQVRVNGA